MKLIFQLKMNEQPHFSYWQLKTHLWTNYFLYLGQSNNLIGLVLLFGFLFWVWFIGVVLFQNSNPSKTGSQMFLYFLSARVTNNVSYIFFPPILVRQGTINPRYCNVLYAIDSTNPLRHSLRLEVWTPKSYWISLFLLFLSCYFILYFWLPLVTTPSPFILASKH